MRPAGVGKEMQKGLEDQEASLQRLLRSLNSAPVTTASSQQTLAKKDHILQDSLSVEQVVVDVLVRAELVETLGRHLAETCTAIARDPVKFLGTAVQSSNWSKDARRQSARWSESLRQKRIGLSFKPGPLVIWLR